MRRSRSVLVDEWNWRVTRRGGGRARVTVEGVAKDDRLFVRLLGELAELFLNARGNHG